MTEPINIRRIYAKEEIAEEAKKLVNHIFDKMS